MQNLTKSFKTVHDAPLHSKEAHSDSQGLLEHG